MMDRIKRNHFRAVAGMLVLGLGWGGAWVRADFAQVGTPLATMQQEYSLGTLQTQVTPISTAAFDKFNPSLGTLQSVTIDLSSVSMKSEIFANYGGRGTTEVTAIINGAATFQVPASLLPTGVSGTISPTFSLTYPKTMTSPADDFDNKDVMLNLDTPVSALVLTLTGDQAQGFVGPGTFSFLFSANASSELKNTNGVGTRGTMTYVSGTPKVIYTYLVPEPASLWLLAVGGLVLPAVARARQRAARA